jgi:hypothetical protein
MENITEKIKIYDNMFSQIDINSIMLFFEKMEWTINKHQSILNPHDKPFGRKELIDFDFFSIDLKTIIEKKVNHKLIVKRVYAVNQTFGQDSNYHIDNKKENNYTFCLYITPNNYIYDSMYEGNFYIKIPNQKYSICIEPHTNRGVFFPANYIHKGTGYDKCNSNLRICISWKFEIIEPNPI